MFRKVKSQTCTSQYGTGTSSKKSPISNGHCLFSSRSTFSLSRYLLHFFLSTSPVRDGLIRLSYQGPRSIFVKKFFSKGLLTLRMLTPDDRTFSFRDTMYVPS